MSRVLPRITLLVVLGLALLPAQAASAQPSATIEIHDRGVALADGTALVGVDVTCSGGQVLEANVGLSQDNQRISGMGFGGGGPCDGRPHTSFVTVEPFDARGFHPGRAAASAFVLVCDDDFNECVQAQDVEAIVLLPEAAG